MYHNHTQAHVHAKASTVVLFALALAVAGTLFSSCAISFGSYGSRFDPSCFEDEAWICTQGDSYSFMYREGLTDMQASALKFRGFYGKQTLWSITMDTAGTLDVAVTIGERLHGRFKVCLVDRKTATAQTIATGLDPVRLHLELAAGDYALMIVGYDAWGAVSIALGPSKASIEPVDDLWSDM